MLRVRDRKTGVERTVTHKAYAAMGPKVYEKLGPAEDEAPAPVKIAPVQNVHRAVSAPVVRKQIPAIEEEQDPEPESDTVETVEAAPKKRGPKPGTKKSISSNSTDDEK